jgi:hypothetical protein
LTIGCEAEEGEHHGLVVRYGHLSSPTLSTLPLYNLDLLVREVVEVVHQSVYLLVRGVYLVLDDSPLTLDPGLRWGRQ